MSTDPNVRFQTVAKALAGILVLAAAVAGGMNVPLPEDLPTAPPPADPPPCQCQCDEVVPDPEPAAVEPEGVAPAVEE